MSEEQARVELPARKEQYFWTVSDGQVRYAKGFECNSPGSEPGKMWWFPSVGYTLTRGYHFFETSEEAYAKAIGEAIEDKQRAEERLDRLQTELKELT